MKIILKPSKQEEAIFYSDIKGKVFDHNIPHATIKIEGNYGSGFDGLSTELHLTDEEATEILCYIKSKLQPDVIKLSGDFWSKF